MISKHPQFCQFVVPESVNPSVREYIKKAEPFKEKKGLPKNYNPAIRSIAPSRIPTMDVDADNIPRRIYPTMIPIFNGI